MILRTFRVILRSLRGRIVVGALLWSIGVFVLLNHVVSRAVAVLFPSVGPTQSVLFILTGSLFALAGLLLVGSALRRVDSVRRGVASLHSGEGKRLEGGGLAELEPLVNDMNALLDHRERVVRRALATAGDLAHGLKTPLAIVAQEAERLETTNESESAATIEEQVERMRRQIEVHLARARTSASGNPYGPPVEIRTVAERLVRTLGRLYTDQRPSITLDIADSCTVRCEPQDLEEMLGNVLENACKWARSEVTLSASQTPDGIAIVVDDDGPGIPLGMRDAVLQRGVRADETESGSGLGLAIVSDLVDAYRGSLALETAPRGGLRVQLVLPRSSAGMRDA
jgi:signal transduction histidine kinase